MTPYRKCRRHDCSERNGASSDFLCELHFAEYKASGYNGNEKRWAEILEVNAEAESRSAGSASFAEDLTKGLNEELTALRKKIESANKSLKAARAEVSRLKLEHQTNEQLLTDSNRDVRDLTSHTQEVKDVARRLWASMPAEGKVAYFESGNNWLPEWIIDPIN